MTTSDPGRYSDKGSKNDRPVAPGSYGKGLQIMNTKMIPRFLDEVNKIERDFWLSILMSAVQQIERDVALLNADSRSISHNEASHFVRILAGKSLTTFVALPDRKNRTKGRPKCLHGSLRSVKEALTKRNQQGYGVHMMVNEGDGRGTKDRNVVRVRAFFVDLDGAPLKPVLRTPLKPHLIVESSNGRFHAYWLVTGCPLGLFKPIQHALAKRFGGDPAVKNLSRLMRLPGFLHNKRTPVRSCLRRASGREPYSCNELMEAFGLDEETLTDVSAPSCYGHMHAGKRDVIRIHHRHSTFVSEGGAMRRRGFGPKAIAAALNVENRERCEEPLPEAEIEAIALSLSKYEPAERDFLGTDQGNAERLVYYHGKDLRYCKELGWLVWDGSRWAKDETGEMERRAKETAKSWYLEASREEDTEKQKTLSRHAWKSQSKRSIKDMIELAKTEADIQIRPAQLDSHPYLLNTPTGTVDLRARKLLKHRRTQYLTKITGAPYKRNAKCPTWKNFLRRNFNNDLQMIRFLRRALGYALVGDCCEQAWFYLYGSGNNGKSTLVTTILYVLGDYGVQTASNTFLARNFDGPGNEIARLRGARFIACSEPDPGYRLNESLLKQFTGQDFISCRFLYKEIFQFRPEGKIFLSANHQATVRGQDYAFWRRVKMIPFNVTIPEEELDKSLPDKLKAEASGILAWMMRGCLLWQKKGLQTPEEVQKATRGYQSDMDVLKEFFQSENLVFGPDHEIQTKAFHDKYMEFCKSRRLKAISLHGLTKRLKDEGCTMKRRGRSKVPYYIGIGPR